MVRGQSDDRSQSAIAQHIRRHVIPMVLASHGYDEGLGPVAGFPPSKVVSYVE